MIRYRFITTRDPEYAQEKALRERVLRQPLGLCLSGDDLRGEEEQTHIVALDDSGRVLGCVLISFAGGAAKARQLAVDEAWRGKGLGAELVRRAEAAVQERGIGRIMLHARAMNRGYFETAGYRAVSGIFAEVAIPHIRMEKALATAPGWLSSWMNVNGITLWGVADLKDIDAPVRDAGTGFPRAIAFAIAMPPEVMAGITNGPNQAYADAYARVNEQIDRLSTMLDEELRSRGHRALRIASSVRTDAVRLAGVFPHKTAATRAGLGWIGKNCQLVTREYGPWVRLGTVLTDVDAPCGSPTEHSRCGNCEACVNACPAKALQGALWQAGMARENILDAHACDRWKRERYYQYHQGRNCGICSAVCPFGLRSAPASGA